MTVNELINETLRLVGRADAADDGDGATDKENMRIRQALLLCFNAVIDELARGYFPLITTENLVSEDGKYMFGDFSLTPYRILSVKSGGKKVRWLLRPQYIECDCGEIEVEYEYVPARKVATDKFEYPDPSVSVTLVEYGMASEYSLICGDAEGCAAWESRYRAELDRLLSVQPVRGRIPPRRWL